MTLKALRFADGGVVDDEEVMDPDADESPSATPAAVTSSGGLSALDMPGAAEAMALLIKSSNDARAALQQAREQISARKYNRAIPLLAASAALGAPTRAGSTAESFGAMSGALVNPLREKAQFEQQQQKDLLGIGTQLSGLDQNNAMAQLQLAQIRAKMAADANNQPNEKVIGADGLPKYVRRQEARGQQAWVPPAAAGTNVSVNTDKSLYGTMGDKLADEYVTQYKTAANAPASIERNNQVRALLKAVPYTGTAADWKLKAGKVAKALGFDYAGNDIANTEVLIANLGQETLNNIHSSGLGSGNGFTDKDLKFLQQVTGGTATLDAKTIAQLTDLHERAARASVSKWNSTYSRLDKERMKQLGLVPVELAPAASAAAPSAPMAPVAPGQDVDDEADDVVPAVGGIPSADEAAATQPGTVSFYNLPKR